MLTTLAGRIFWLAAALPLLALLPMAAAAEAPQVLPKMTVGAGVPLVKVAEYQMLEPRLGPAAAAHNGFIYIVSGLVGEGTASNAIERFDPRSGKSEIIARLRVARLWHRAIFVGEKLYVLGGVAPGQLPSNYLANVASAAEAGRRTNSVVLPPSAEGRVDLEASVEIFDLATGQVSAGPAMREPRDQFACVEAGGQIFVIGGQHEFRDKLSFTNTVEVLDVAKNQWRPGVPMPTVRATDGAVVSGGFIIVPGGYNGLFATDAVEVFDLRAGTWSKLAPLCTSTSAHAAVFFEKYLFLFGDYNSPERLLAYNLKTRSSETFTLGYTAARHCAAVVVDDRIYVIGGRAFRDTDPLRVIQVFASTKAAAARP